MPSIPSAVPRNQLLARLPKAEFEKLAPHLNPIALAQDFVFYRAKSAIDYVYFLNRGAASALAMMTDGKAIEVATIGNEGVVGLTVFVGAKTTPNEVIMQVPGEGLRMDALAFEKEANREGPFRSLLLLYHTAFLTQISQSVACNGLHPVQQRCCRWLLITHDRVEGDVLELTHEFLAIMLGVRRASITEVLSPLHEAGIIKNHRGNITILNRKKLEAGACECYRTVKNEFDRLLR